MDFTHCSGLGVTIGGETFRHLLFHLVLSHSGWSYAEVCFGETFAALVKGLQGALWELGGVPRVVRTDNLSAATHELRDSRGRAVNASYEAVLMLLDSVPAPKAKSSRLTVPSTVACAVIEQSDVDSV